MSDVDLRRTRAALHAVAELVLAGPQHRFSDTIRLEVSRAGFRTIAEPTLAVVGTDLIANGASFPLSGRTARELGTSVGAVAGAPVGLYSDGCGTGLDEPLYVDPAAAARITDAYECGDRALRLLAPDVEPVLWPEHFDVAIRVDDVNYGVSPGDGYLSEPYAYIGIGAAPAEDGYWNAPFGRARPMTSFADPAALRDYFAEGRDRRT